MATVYHWLTPEDAQYLATAFPQFLKINGTSFPVSGLAFDAATTESCYWKFHATTYGSGNLTLEIFWYADTATTADVVFDAQVAAITANTDSGDVEVKALATANTVTDTNLGATLGRVHSVSITISNLDSIANGDICWLKFTRDITDAADTMAGDCIITGCLLSYSDT